MKVGGNMAKKIKGISNLFGDPDGNVERRMILRYINGDWNFDVIEYIESTQNKLRYKAGGGYESTIKTLNYFKYLFLSGKGENGRAMAELKTSFKRRDPDAVAQYAYYFYTGQTIVNKPDYRKATKLFEYALKEGGLFVEMLYADALMYNNENNIGINEQVIPYYEKAMKKGLVMNRYKLANCYLRTKTNLAKAEELFSKCDEPDAKAKLEEVRALRRKNHR